MWLWHAFLALLAGVATFKPFTTAYCKLRTNSVRKHFRSGRSKPEMLMQHRNSLLCVGSANSQVQIHTHRSLTTLTCTSGGEETNERTRSDDLMGDLKFKTFDMDGASKGQQPDGYLNADMKNMAEGQKSRVLAYIGLALVPCLFLVPFFLSRDFTPPTIE
jgi:hypothetical protein